MKLIDKEEIIVGDFNTAKVLNTFFSNIVSNLNIVEYSNCEPLANNICDPTLKNWKHPSIPAIGEVCNKHPRLPFSFLKIREILKLETSKAFQDTDIPTKIIKENAQIFADILLANFNDSLRQKCPNTEFFLGRIFLYSD